MSGSGKGAPPRALLRWRQQILRKLEKEKRRRRAERPESPQPPPAIDRARPLR